MPTAPLPACLSPRCPGYAVSRGYCEQHKRSEAERHYGVDWRRVRTIVRREVQACERCGATGRLAVDHIVPQSLGGTSDRSNLRVLCFPCHGAIGMTSHTRTVR